MWVDIWDSGIMGYGILGVEIVGKWDSRDEVQGYIEMQIIISRSIISE